MKLPCAVVRDLLPLFAEKMTGLETQCLIEEHLQECPDCQTKYAEIEPGISSTVDAAVPLRTLKKEIRRRRWYAALIAGLFVFVSIIVWMVRTDGLKQIPWQAGLVEVSGVKTVAPDDEFLQTVHNTRGEDDSSDPREEVLVLKLDSQIAGVESETIEDDDGTVTVLIQGFGRSSSIGQHISHQDGEMMIRPIPDRLIYGYEEPQKILWGKPSSGGVVVLPRLALAYYVLMALVLAVIFGLLWLIFRKKRWGWVIRQVFFAPTSYAIAHLLLMGFRTTSIHMLWDFSHIVVIACALYAMFSLLLQIWLQRKRSV